MRYPSGKGQPGIYQRLISLMPPHDVYIETHAGGGNLFERKRPAPLSYLVDVDGDVFTHWRRFALSWKGGALHAVHGDAAAFLQDFDFSGRRVLIYCDPPYVAATCRSSPRYRFNYSDEQHHELLTLLRELPALVMLSGYRCPMYDAALARWRRLDYPAWTRSGSWAVESCWFNFDPPARLHDSRYIGAGFRERERIRRKQARWRRRLSAMSAMEREAMLAVLLELVSPGPAVRSSSPEMTLPDLAPAVAMPARASLAASDDADVVGPLAFAGDAYRPAQEVSPCRAVVDANA